MQYELRHLLILVTFSSVLLSLTILGPVGVCYSATLAVGLIGFGFFYQNRHKTRCPEYLKLRYHLPVLVILFLVTQYFMPYFFAYGFWTPTNSLMFWILSAPLIPTLQLVKWDDVRKPHIAIRIIQLAYLWWLFTMTTIVVMLGSYIGP